MGMDGVLIVGLDVLHVTYKALLERDESMVTTFLFVKIQSQTN